MAKYNRPEQGEGMIIPSKLKAGPGQDLVKNKTLGVWKLYGWQEEIPKHGTADQMEKWNFFPPMKRVLLNTDPIRYEEPVMSTAEAGQEQSEDQEPEEEKPNWRDL